MIFVYDKMIADLSTCKLPEKVIATIYPLSIFFVFESKGIETLLKLDNCFSS